MSEKMFLSDCRSDEWDTTKIQGKKPISSTGTRKSYSRLENPRIKDIYSLMLVIKFSSFTHWNPLNESHNLLT